MAQVDGLPCLVPSAMWKLYTELNEDTFELLVVTYLTMCAKWLTTTKYIVSKARLSAQRFSTSRSDGIIILFPQTLFTDHNDRDHPRSTTKTTGPLRKLLSTLVVIWTPVSFESSTSCFPS